jgi:hypothetical protein
MSVANYSPKPFAPGNDPRVWDRLLPRPSGLRAASINPASSIQPWNGRESLVPFETHPLIGSESMSIASTNCVASVVTVRTMPT